MKLYRNTEIGALLHDDGRKKPLCGFLKKICYEFQFGAYNLTEMVVRPAYGRQRGSLCRAAVLRDFAEV